jgi:hypothetical protein
VDWILVWNRRHLGAVLAQHVTHDHAAGPHRGLGLDMPVPTAQPAPAEVGSIRRVKGPMCSAASSTNTATPPDQSTPPHFAETIRHRRPRPIEAPLAAAANLKRVRLS